MPAIKVLVIDDSAAVREAMKAVISAEPDLEVMATASDPVRAVEVIRTEVPDVITLDVEMPRMDGITFLRRLMSQHPIPVVMCSSLVEPDSETLTEAMQAGAVDVICKPKFGVKGFLEESRIEICDAIRGAANARLIRAPKVATQVKKTTSEGIQKAPTKRAMSKTTEKVVAVGASTGGTEALRYLFESLPADCPGIAVVQHMPPSFTKAFANRLNDLCKVTVKEAENGDRLLRGQVLIAPGGRHMLVARQGAQYIVEVRDGPLVSRHRPSVDVLFRSVARSAGANAVGVIMTGMGDDGATGLSEMRQAGAQTIGQDEASSVVYGMPKAAYERGAVAHQVSLEKMPATLINTAS